MRRESTGVWPLIGKMRLINHTEGRSSGDRILSEPPAAAAAAGPGVSGTPSRREDARFYFFFSHHMWHSLLISAAHPESLCCFFFVFTPVLLVQIRIGCCSLSVKSESKCSLSSEILPLHDQVIDEDYSSFFYLIFLYNSIWLYSP